MVFQHHFIQSYLVYFKVFLFFRSPYVLLKAWFLFLYSLFLVFFSILQSLFNFFKWFLYSAILFILLPHFVLIFIQKFVQQVLIPPCLKYHLDLVSFYKFILLHQQLPFLLFQFQAILFLREITIFLFLIVNALLSFPLILYRTPLYVFFMLLIVSR